MEFLVAALLALSCCPALIQGHGYLFFPPGRSTVWRHGPSLPSTAGYTRQQILAITNYDDNSLFCGGRPAYEANGRRCGECGDDFAGVRKNQPGPGNKYAKGIITAEYTEGQTIDAQVRLTANHLGYFEFRLCAVNDPNTRATQACLDQHLLTFADTGLTRYNIASETKQTPGKPFDFKLNLPQGVSCTQCVLQWRYYGAVTQELYQNCADVAIQATAGNRPSPPTSVPTTTATPTTTPTSTTTTTTEAPASTTSTTMAPATASTRAPVQQASTRAPVQQASTRAPVQQASTRAPVQQASTRAPVQPASTRAPVQQASTRAPVRPASTRAPVRPSTSRPRPVKPSTGRVCKPTRHVAHIRDIANWCNRNCNHKPAFCPRSHCVCSYRG